jgi:hypothetical protein
MADHASTTGSTAHLWPHLNWRSQLASSILNVMVSGRNISLGSVALVAVLSGAASIWSGLSGPKVADVQVRQAAANLVAASSFVVTIDETQAVLGTDQQAQVVQVVDYQSPDRQSSVQTITSGTTRSVRKIVQVGSSCWIQSTGPGDSLPCVSNGAERLLAPIKKLESISDVTNVGGTYVLSPTASARAISSEVSGITIGQAMLKVRISGDAISTEQVSLNASVQGATIMINEAITFSRVGNGPPVVAPAGPPTATA